MNVCICIGGCSRCTGSGSESKSIIIKAGFSMDKTFNLEICIRRYFHDSF